MCDILARDVLAYLNDLGYTNVEAQHLKAFIKDLKKLIKQDLYSAQEKDNINELQYSNYSSRIESRTGSLVAVQMPEPDFPCTSKNYNREQHNRITNRQYYKKSSTVTIPDKSTINSQLSIPAFLSASCQDNQQSANTQWKMNKKLSEISLARPTSSFIRVKSQSLKPCRSDPVALYHYYQEQWKHTKIPGKDSHLDLRWTIREKMLGDQS